MTPFETAKEHFAKTDDLLLVQVNGNDWLLNKMWFKAWVRGDERIFLHTINKFGNRAVKLILTKNITIKKEIK